jgi:hypothetical protein
LVTLIVTIILFRWLGAIIFVIVRAVATVIIATRRAAEQQSLLTSASINNRDSVTRADRERCTDGYVSRTTASESLAKSCKPSSCFYWRSGDAR